MNIFAGLQKYATKYEVKNSRPLNNEELSGIVSAKIVASQYGLSCCFFMTSGCQQYIPLSRDSVAQVGDVVDVKSIKILMLDKEGADEILRVEI